MTSERLAIRLMIAQSVLFAAETAVIHRIGTSVSIMAVACIRAIAGIILALILARRAGVPLVRTRQLRLQLIRGGVAAGYLWVMVYSFAHLPFADATAISYTQAAYIAVLSVFILGEVVSPARWLAAALGIGGALLVAKPSFAGWNGIYLIALLGTGLNGLSFVLNRYLQREDSEATTMFYSNLVPSLAYAPSLFLAVPSAGALSWLPAIMLFGPVGMYAGIVALRHASAAMLAPYTLLRLVVAMGAGIILFYEVPDAWSVIGAAIILLGCAISSGLAGEFLRLLQGARLQPARDLSGN
jgi:drug/metabolite transporter (DMT)-like permease